MGCHEVFCDSGFAGAYWARDANQHYGTVDALVMMVIVVGDDQKKKKKNKGETVGVFGIDLLKLRNV